MGGNKNEDVSDRRKERRRTWKHRGAKEERATNMRKRRRGLAQGAAVLAGIALKYTPGEVAEERSMAELLLRSKGRVGLSCKEQRNKKGKGSHKT